MTPGDNRKLLILDLDETLVHGAETAIRSDCSWFRVASFFVYRRPHVETFLSFCREHYRIAVWTSSSADYAEAVVAEVFGPGYPLEFVWSRNRCVRRMDFLRDQINWIKDLKKVKKWGYPLEHVLIVDDTPAKLVRNYGNHICIEPFIGAEDDDQLLLLGRYLSDLLPATNVRTLEKRSWQTRYRTS